MNLQRTFIPGEEWVFLKIYGGPKFLEQVLVQEIYGILEEMNHTNINYYFFIRYADPDYHIRLRMHNLDPGPNYPIIASLTSALAQKVRDRSLWRISYETYHREIERYGSRCIELVEQLFYLDSTTILKFLLESDCGNEFRWLYSMYWIDQLTSAFQFSDDKKVNFFDGRVRAYASEFDLQKWARVNMDKKYRKVSGQIDRLLLADGKDFISRNIKPGVFMFGKDSATLIDKILEMDSRGMLEIDLDSLVSSLIHMHVNRMFRTRPRVYELLIYYFLNKFHRSRMARNKYSLNP